MQDSLLKRILRNSFSRLRRQGVRLQGNTDEVQRQKFAVDGTFFTYARGAIKADNPRYLQYFPNSANHWSSFSRLLHRQATVSLTEYFRTFSDHAVVGLSRNVEYRRHYNEPARSNEYNLEPHNCHSNSEKRRDNEKKTSILETPSGSSSLDSEETLDALKNPRAVLPLDDIKFLFSRLSTSELVNALLNLEIAANNLAVDFGKKVLRSSAMNYSLLRIPLMWGVKNTSFKHFCAGETLEEASACLLKMFELGLKGILDFSVEDAHTNEICDKNLQNFIKTIDLTTTLPRGAVSFACVKISALCPLSSLEKASNLLRTKHSHPSLSLPWMFKSLPVLSPESPPFLPHSIDSVSSEVAPLTPQEEKDIRACHSRLVTIANICKKFRLSLLIDAEYQSIQPVIDHLAYSLMLDYNATDYPLIFTTVQAYLRDSKSRLQLAIDSCRESNVCFGVKLVRGAYLSRETEMSKRMNVPNPVFSTIDQTHANYDACAKLMLDSMKKNDERNWMTNAVVLATHNYNSGCQAVLNASNIGIGKEDNRFHFAQLKGMADTLSLSLLFSGYNVSKYLAYGSVMEVMPYLLRRAEENSAILSNTLPERKRMRSELWRRFTSWFGFSIR